MNTTGYRVTYTLLAIALVAIVAGGIFLIPSGNPAQIPDAVERYSPLDGDIAINPVKVVLDLAPNYDARFVIDGIPIPASDVDSIIETGRHQFEPGPGKAIERWAPGEHTVLATWVGGAAQADAGSLVWSFEVQ